MSDQQTQAEADAFVADTTARLGRHTHQIEGLGQLVDDLKARIAALEARPASAPPPGNAIALTSPNGKYSVVLKADDNGAGVWVCNPDESSQAPSAALYVGYGSDQAYAGVWGQHSRLQPTKGIDAALVGGPSNTPMKGCLLLKNQGGVDEMFDAFDVAQAVGN